MRYTLKEDIFDSVDDKVIADDEVWSELVPNAEIELVKPVKDEAPSGPEVGVDTTIANEIISNINDEWSTIAKYNGLVSDLAQANLSEFVPVIEDITNEEHKHVGQLQEILKKISPNTKSIEEGEVEGASQLTESLADPRAIPGFVSDVYNALSDVIDKYLVKGYNIDVGNIDYACDVFIKAYEAFPSYNESLKEDYNAANYYKWTDYFLNNKEDFILYSINNKYKDLFNEPFVYGIIYFPNNINNDSDDMYKCIVEVDVDEDSYKYLKAEKYFIDINDAKDWIEFTVNKLNSEILNEGLNSMCKNSKLIESYIEEDSLSKQARDIYQYLEIFLDRISNLENLEDYLDEYDIEELQNTHDALVDFEESYSVSADDN